MRDPLHFEQIVRNDLGSEQEAEILGDPLLQLRDFIDSVRGYSNYPKQQAGGDHRPAVLFQGRGEVHH